MIDLASADVVFISYDEPEADANFARLQALVPRARRVHGVKGFDAAHRRAGDVTGSDWVATVDGDNWVTDAGFFHGKLDHAPRDLGQVFSFSARNVLNGLRYGNGGVKLWPRHVLQGLHSHENARRPQGALDFWTVPFYLINRDLSEVRVTATPAQAFRAGYREGVKLTMIGGRRATDVHPDLAPPEALALHLGPANLERLRVWCSVGGDRPNGDWAIFGARLGCVRTALECHSANEIADYDAFASFWLDPIWPQFQNPSRRAEESEALARRIDSALGLALPRLDAKASAAARLTVRGVRAYGPLQPI